MDNYNVDVIWSNVPKIATALQNFILNCIRHINLIDVKEWQGINGKWMIGEHHLTGSILTWRTYIAQNRWESSSIHYYAVYCWGGSLSRMWCRPGLTGVTVLSCPYMTNVTDVTWGHIGRPEDMTLQKRSFESWQQNGASPLGKMATRIDKMWKGENKRHRARWISELKTQRDRKIWLLVIRSPFNPTRIFHRFCCGSQRSAGFD